MAVPCPTDEICTAQVAESFGRFSRVKQGTVWTNGRWSRAVLKPEYAAIDDCAGARTFRFDYLLVESTGISKLLPAAEPRLGRRTALTFPLLAPGRRNSPRCSSS